MINFKNISGLLVVVAIAIYMLFGDPDCYFWGGYYYLVWDYTILWLGSLVLKTQRDKLLLILIKIIMGISLAKFVLNIYSFYDVEIFNKINRSHELGGVVIGSVIIFLIYKKNELVKRQTRITVNT